MPRASRRAEIFSGLGAPLRTPAFRRIWTSSILSNLGQQVLAVSAAWTMVQMQAPTRYVALVQTASMLPVMLFALPAGAVADMYDKRKAAIAALILAAVGALYLTFVSALAMLNPVLLLSGCFMVGCGVAFFSPIWQSSANEQVGHEAMPAAVALSAVSSNLARSVGPAVGGLLIASTGSTAAFTVTALLYLPILCALALWRRELVPPRLPPEGVSRAVHAGLRYIRYSSPVRRVLIRAFAASLGTAAVYALLPLVARDILGQGARTYGILLGAFGIGAVSAIFLVQPFRTYLSPEQGAVTCAGVSGLAIAGMALSPWAVLTAAMACITGMAWMLTTSLYNVGVQTSAPRWVAGRVLASFQAATAAGLALGAWSWGVLAGEAGVTASLLCAAGMLLLSPVLGLIAPMPGTPEAHIESVPSTREPDLHIAINGRSGPIMVEIEYRIAEADARRFYDLMRQNQRGLERNGAFNVSLARDLADPQAWLRRYHYATWNDYLRARDRPIRQERDLNDALVALQVGGAPLRIRRGLERPFGSVRWTDAAQDGAAELLPAQTGI